MCLVQFDLVAYAFVQPSCPHTNAIDRLSTIPGKQDPRNPRLIPRWTNMWLSSALGLYNGREWLRRKDGCRNRDKSYLEYFLWHSEQTWRFDLSVFELVSGCPNALSEGKSGCTNGASDLRHAEKVDAIWSSGRGDGIDGAQLGLSIVTFSSRVYCPSKLSYRRHTFCCSTFFRNFCLLSLMISSKQSRID